MRIGLSGKFCSGKDTVGAALGIPRYAFADGMKDEVAGLLTLKGVSTSRDDINEHKAQFRSMLQVYGTDFVRHHVDDNYWVKRLLANIPDKTSAVVTDVRFPNEAEALQDNGFLVVRLDVPQELQVKRYQMFHGTSPEPSQFTHISETALDDYPFIFRINASKPIDEVVADVKNLWAYWNTMRPAPMVA